MEYLGQIIHFFLNLDQQLVVMVGEYGMWIYIILFLIVFCETGLVATPFLPGDSLLFAAGSLAALGQLKVIPIIGLLSLAAILGDTVNYWIGHSLGDHALKMNSRFIRRDYLIRTQKFYEIHGGKTIFLARFIPIIRTFAPFVAGIGTMGYYRFVVFNVIGGLTWVVFLTLGGYYLGNLPLLKNNFSLIILLIILISILPLAGEFIRSRRSPGTMVSEE